MDSTQIWKKNLIASWNYYIGCLFAINYDWLFYAQFCILTCFHSHSFGSHYFYIHIWCHLWCYYLGICLINSRTFIHYNCYNDHLDICFNSYYTFPYLKNFSLWWQSFNIIPIFLCMDDCFFLCQSKSTCLNKKQNWSWNQKWISTNSM